MLKAVKTSRNLPDTDEGRAGTDATRRFTPGQHGDDSGAADPGTDNPPNGPNLVKDPDIGFQVAPCPSDLTQVPGVPADIESRLIGAIQTQFPGADLHRVCSGAKTTDPNGDAFSLTLRRFRVGLFFDP